MKKETKEKESNGHILQNLRLKFFWIFIQRIGLTMNEVACIMGITPQSLFRLKRLDDIKLSRLRLFLENIGYTLEVSLKHNPYAKDDSPARLGGWYIYHDRGQLQFLCEALGSSGITMEMLCEGLGFTSTPIHHSFKTNDISFSRLCKIADTFGMSVIVRIRPMENKVKLHSIPGSRLIASISFKEMYENDPIISD